MVTNKLERPTRDGGSLNIVCLQSEQCSNDHTWTYALHVEKADEHLIA